MRKLLPALAFVASINASFSQTAPFPCNNTAYFLNGLNSNVQLSTYNLVTGVSSTPIVSFNTLVNALAYNPTNNLLYALVTPSPLGSGLPKLNMIDANGVVTALSIPNLASVFPSGLPNPTSAGITPDGYYVFKRTSSNIDSGYAVIDLNSARPSTYLQVVDPTNNYAIATAPYYKTASANMSVTDLAYNAADGLFYGITSTGNLATLNVVTGAYTIGNAVTLNGTAIGNSGSSYGSVYIDATGSLYTITNGGGSYKVAIANGISGTGSGVAVQLASGPTVTNTDGANCPSAIFSYPISGNVYNDVNGLTDNTVNGTGTNTGGILYAVLYDNTTGKVLASVPVAADGTYTLGGTPGNTYTVYLTTTQPTIGQTATPTLTLPTGWVRTGENLGSEPAVTTTQMVF